jgi:DNA-binding beta-propeller fold protein YncE
MRNILLILATAMLGFCCTIYAQEPEQSNLLTEVRTIPLDGVEGRIDHLGLDGTGKRLFIATLGNDSVDVVDLVFGKVTQRISKLRGPQGIGFAPDSNRLAVTNGRDGSLRLYDGTSLLQTATVELRDDADNVRYDAVSRRFWVGYGEGGLAAIDPDTGREIIDVKLDAHPESFQLETKGNRIFVNIPGVRQIAVIDRESGTTIRKFVPSEASENFPMALDEADHRLLIGCHSPAKLLVLDTETGKTIAALDIVGDADDMFYDSSTRRIYVSGGEGQVTVIERTNAGEYKVAGQVATAPGARTSLFVNTTGILYVAVPHRDQHRAEIRVFRVLGAR